jgi:hypothetical protein
MGEGFGERVKNNNTNPLDLDGRVVDEKLKTQGQGGPIWISAISPKRCAET